MSSTRPGGYEAAIKTTDPLVQFLYTLLRDHLSAGVVQSLVNQACLSQMIPVRFSNDWLAAYAVELSCMLRREPPEKALATAHAVLREAQTHDLAS